MFKLNQASHLQQNWAVLYLECAKNHFKNAKGFWKRDRKESYIKLLHTTYHPVRMASRFFKSVGRVIKGIFLLIYATFSRPSMTVPKILGGIGLEVLALLTNIFNVFFFCIPDIIKGIVWGFFYNLI